MNIMTIVGARPQFIKAAPVSRLLAEMPQINHDILHTGQHYDDNMSNIFFQQLNIPPANINLGIGSGHHGAQTGKMLAYIEEVLIAKKPNMVLIYGDTNSTLAGALAAAKLHIPVAHVEAGLRSFNKRMPEEINRIAADHMSDWLFTPTDQASKNLRNENIPEENIKQVGDVMYDAALYYSKRADQNSRVLKQYQLENRPYILVTIHRAENTDDFVRLHNIVAFLQHLNDNIQVIFPLHPRTRSALNTNKLLSTLQQNITLIEPQAYLDMVMLEKHAEIIVTDSGGVQKEAYFYGVPCVTVRDETEWVETVAAGWNRLAPPYDVDRMLAICQQALNCPGEPINLYGDGHGAEKIVAFFSTIQV